MSTVKFVIIFVVAILLSIVAIEGKDYVVNIYNVDGNKMPMGGGRIDVYFNDFDTGKPYYSFAEYKGGEPYIIVKLTNGPNALKSIIAYQYPLSSLKEKEYWGLIQVDNAKSTEVLQLTRDMPYISAFTVNGIPAWQQKQTIKKKQPMIFKITIKDNSWQEGTIKMYVTPIIFIREKGWRLFGTNDIATIDSGIKDMGDLNKKGVRTQSWEITYTLDNEGTYEYNVKVLADVGMHPWGSATQYKPSGQPDISDQWDWIEFDVIK